MSESLKNAFLAFANYGAGANTKHVLDGRSWVKLLKDAKIIGGKFTSTDADLIFAKCKEKGTTTLSFPQFCTALDEVAAKKGVSRADIEAKVEAASPTTIATKAEAVKYHDDKTLYTGVYANGGPQAVDKSKAGPGGVLANLCDRSPADARGVKM